MIIVLTGAPGAGKGTQADFLAKRCGFRKISTGDALRNQIKRGTEIGKKAEGVMAQGKLVPDDVLFEVLKQELGDRRSETILLDGYPRNTSQAQTLETLGSLHPVMAALHLDVASGELIRRLSGRRVCENCGSTFHTTDRPAKKTGVCDNCQGKLIQRPDDHPDKVAVRLNVYNESTAPVLDFYRKKGIYHKLDGAGDAEVVYGAIKQVIEKQGIRGC